MNRKEMRTKYIGVAELHSSAKGALDLGALEHHTRLAD